MMCPAKESATVPSNFHRPTMQYRARGILLPDPRLDMLQEQLVGLAEEAPEEQW